MKKTPRKDGAKGDKARKSAAAAGKGAGERSSGSGSGKGRSGGRRAPKLGLTPLVARGVLAICLAATVLVVLFLVFGSPFTTDSERDRAPGRTAQSASQGKATPPGRKDGNASRGELPQLPQFPQLSPSPQFSQLPQTPVGEKPTGDMQPSVPGKGQSPAPQPVAPASPVTRDGAAGAAGTGNERDDTGPEVRQPVSPGNLPYEETLDAPVESGVKQVDYALIQTVTRLGLGRDRLRLVSIENRHGKGQAFHFQRMEMRLDGAPDHFVQVLRETLAAWSDTANVEVRADDLLVITVEGMPTHEISLLLYEGTPPPVSVAPGGARLVIVIDDIGESMSAVRELASLDFPVTFSVWPRSSHAREAAEAAHRAGREVMIHLPMEPVRYPQVKPGPGAILISQKPPEIAALVADAVRRVPYARGLNNHMGSRATQDAAAMRAVCGALDGTGLFVLDSVTHQGSKLFAEAKRAGLPAFRRNVFLDVIAEKRSIVFQLDKAARIAQAEGKAIAIGHPLPETIAALKEWARTRDRTVQIVSIRQLSD